MKIKLRIKTLILIISLFVAIKLLQFITTSLFASWPRSFSGGTQRPLGDHNDPQRLQIFTDRLTGPIPQGDEDLIAHIRNGVLQEPSNLPYNLSKSVFSSIIRASAGFQFIDRVLKTLFSGQKNGFFVEAGALDGEYLSNTLWLEKKLNWTGLLVEPDDVNFRDLVFKGRKSWISHSCLSSERHPKKIVMVSTRKFKKQVTKDKFAFRGSTYELGYNSSARGSRDLVKDSDQQYFTSQCYPLYSFLLALNVTVVDFLSLDIQGADLKVFDTLPLSKIKIRSLVIENESPVFDRDFIKYFNNKGFIWLAAGGAPDYFFVYKDESLIKRYNSTPWQVYFDNGYNISVNFE